MEAVCPSETVSTYKYTRCRNPEDTYRYSNRSENFKSQKRGFILTLERLETKGLRGKRGETLSVFRLVMFRC